MKSKARVIERGVRSFTAESHVHTDDGTTSTDWDYPPIRSIQRDTENELIEWEQGGKGAFNECRHTKLRVRWDTLPSYTVRFWNDPGITATQSFTGWFAWDVGSLASVAFDTPMNLFRVSQFHSRAWQAIRPRFRSDFSAPNFLYELKDLGTTAKGLIEGGKLISNLLKGILPSPKAAANQNLNIQYGIMTFIRDVMDYAQACTAFNTKLKQFVEGSAKFHKSHYTEKIPVGTVVRHDLPSAPQYLLYFEDKTEQVEMTATVEYTYVLEGMPYISIPKLFLQYLGFRNNPGVLWEAIPFSFCVDWVLSVSKTIDALDNGAIKATCLIVAAGYSYKFRTERRLYADARFGLGQAYEHVDLGDRAYCGGLDYEFYHRLPSPPSVVQSMVQLAPLPQLRTPGLNQIFLGVSLLAGLNYRKPKKSHIIKRGTSLV